MAGIGDGIAWTILWTVNITVLVYFIVLNGHYLLMGAAAFHILRGYLRRMSAVDFEDLLTEAGAPPITLIAPAYNEAATCVPATRALLNLIYPEYEVLVVNDGSTDETLERLTEAFDLEPAPRSPTTDLETAKVREVYRSRVHPNLWVVDKENGGKADALNVGVSYCRTPLFCAIDADTLLDRHALQGLVRPFVEDSRTIAAGGAIRVANGCTVREGKVTEIRLPDRLLPRIQVLEYLRAFFSGRLGWDALGASLIISGAFGIFRRDVVVAVDGYERGSVTEDMELVIRLHRFGVKQEEDYRVRYIPDPVAWTEVPESLAVLGRQRDRWQRGLADAMAKHRDMLFNPRYGRIGMLAFPHFFFLEMLGPVIEGVGYVAFAVTVALGMASLPYVLAFLGLAVVLSIVLSMMSVAMEEMSIGRYQQPGDFRKLFWLPFLENAGYRQLSVWWRLRGLISYMRGIETWGEMTRTGFGEGAS